MGKLGVSTGLHISAITWNMGNEAASEKVVKEFITQLTLPNGDKPEVVAIATQEEMAPEGKRLQDRLLEVLNKSLPGNEQYVLVQTEEPQFHTTMAGANHSFFTLTSALLTSDNRVSCALLVKKPLSVTNAVARIDYETKEKGNKSVITLEGQLNMPGKEPLNISISGGHWNAQSEIKRRKHSMKFLENQRLTSPDRTFDELLKEAGRFRLLLGDFNERDKLMKSGIVNDGMAQNLYASYGFDVTQQPQQRLGEEPLHGTYGFRFTNHDLSKPQLTAVPDQNRTHVTKGGYLDRIAYCSGLTIETSQYGAKLDSENFKLNKEGKWCYHRSDHTPVMRNFALKSPRAGEKYKMVGDYIKRILPDYLPDCLNFYHLLHNLSNLEQLKKRSLDYIYYDSSANPIMILQQLADAESQDFNVIYQGLVKSSVRKEKVREIMIALSASINVRIETKNTLQLEHIFNSVMKCNQVRDAVLEVLSNSSVDMSDWKKSEFMKIADKLVDLFYIHALSSLSGVKESHTTEFEEVKKRMHDFLMKNQVGFENFTKITQVVLLPSTSVALSRHRL